MIAIYLPNVHLVSPILHQAMVKEVLRANGSYIRKNNNSLSFFLPFTPTPSRDARTRVSACVCERGVKEERSD